jgi:hypothetical protein
MTNTMNLTEQRAEANKELLGIIQKGAAIWPYLRMSQLLLNLGVIVNGVDLFYEEPWKTLERVKKTESYRDLITA